MRADRHVCHTESLVTLGSSFREAMGGRWAGEGPREEGRPGDGGRQLSGEALPSRGAEGLGGRRGEGGAETRRIQHGGVTARLPGVGMR